MSTVALPARVASSTLASTDHKRIAGTACAIAFLFFLAGGLLALLMRSQLAADGGVVSQQTYNELFTMHGSTMVYLVIVPVALAVGIYFVPLQVGAAEIAGPRVVLAGLWMYVCGGALMWSGFLTSGGAASASWWGFDPLSESIHSPGSGMELWIFGVMLATLGQILWAGCILLTALRARAPGMTLMRMPVFTWTMVVTCLMVVFGFPALLLALGLLWAQRHFGGVLVGGSGAVDYQALFWFYGHPVVYVMFFPFVGMVGEVLATFSARRFFGYSAFVVALLAFAGLSMTVWAHHMFTFGVLSNKYFALTSTALIVPAGVEYFDFLATIWRGSLRFTTAFLFALGFLVQFLVGGLTGVIVASPPLDYGLNMSYFVVAHFHYTIFAGSAFGLFAGNLLLVSEDHRCDVARAAGKGAFRADGDRHEPHLLPDVHSRCGGHDTPDRALPRLQRLAGVEHPRDRGVGGDRAVGARVHAQRARLAAPPTRSRR